MKRVATLVLGLLVLACTVTSPAMAGPTVVLTQAGGVKFPQRAFLLTLGSRGVVTSRQVTVTENGSHVSPLSVEPASAIGESHFGTVLLVDSSQSMVGTAEDSAVQAMRTFVQSRNPKQPVAVVFFNQNSTVVAPLTTDNGTLDKALATVPALHTGTHIYDAVNTALDLLAKANLTGGSIVVASDGRDTGSKASLQAVAAKAASQGVRFYTVGVRDPSFDGSTLQSLAAGTGGVYTPVDSSALVPLYHDLGISLANQYLLRYESRSPLGKRVVVAAHVDGHGTGYTSYFPPTPAPVTPAAPTHGTSASFWSSTAAAFLVCLLCAMLLGVAVLALSTQRTGVRDRVGPYVGLSPQPIEDKPRSLVQRALGDPRSRRQNKSGRLAVLAEEIDVARIQVTPGRLVILTVIAMVVLGYLLLTIEGPLAALLVFTLPVAVRIGVRVMANRQRREFSEQLPDNLGVVASALRAGNTFAGSLGVVASDAPEPSRRELRRALADEQLGVPLVDALNKISDRMQSSDFHHVALVATLQQETGGNTAEVLDVVNETIRERLELRRLVRTLTAQGRLAGMVLSALPVLLLIALSLINPHYVSPLFHQAAGIIALCIAATMMIIGSLVIRKIVNIDV